MSKYVITESTMNAINAARGIKAQYTELLLPGEKRVKKVGEQFIGFGAIEKIAEGGEVFTIPVPFLVNEGEIEAENLSVAVSSNELTTALATMSKKQGDIELVVDEDSSRFLMSKGNLKNEDVKFYQPGDVPMSASMSVKDEKPTVAIKFNAAELAERVKFVSGFGAEALNIRITKDGMVRILPTLFSNLMLAQSTFEKVEVENSKEGEEVNIVIPAKYNAFFSAPVYAKEVIFSAYDGKFTISSGGARFIGNTAEGKVIPESMMNGKSADIKASDTVLVFLDKSALLTDLAIANDWHKSISDKGEQYYPVLKAEPTGDNELALEMSAGYRNIAAVSKMMRKEGAGEHYLLANSLMQAVSAASGNVITLGLMKAGAGDDAASAVIVIDGNISEDGKKNVMTGNKTFMIGCKKSQYEALCDKLQTLAESKVTPLEAKKMAEKAKAAAKAEKASAKKPGKKAE